MAELRVVGNYVGPGEQRTAETLAAELPDAWVIIANRSLPTREQDDMDLVVIGTNLVFLLEEKAWGPVVRLGPMWEVGREGQFDRRPNPIQRVSKVARILAGLLRRVNAYPQRGRLVLARVVMSHPTLELDETDAGEEADLVLLLKDAAQELLESDTNAREGLGLARQEVIEFISGWGGRPERPASIGTYTVLGEVAGLGRAKVYAGRNDVRQLVLLRCYPMDGWGPGADPLAFVRRERTAIERVAAAGRTLRSDPVFTDDERRWHVVPIVFDQEIASLTTLLSKPKPPIHPHSSDPLEVARFVRDAFEGLAQLHAEGVLHRGIHPTRVGRASDGRVKFLDLYLAHVSGEETIAADVSDLADIGYEFSAPECSEYMGFATPASDLFSLAKSLLWWLNGVPTASAVETEPPSVRSELIPLAALLRQCLDSSPGARPTVAALVVSLAALEESAAGRTDESETSDGQIVRPKPTESTSPQLIAAGALILGRWELERELGRGGYAESWLARDTQLDEPRVLKLYKSGVTVEQARREYQAADEIRHDRCSRVYDLISTPPLMLISEYVPGENLEDASKLGVDAADYRNYALDILQGLADIHQRDFLHRDVTPRNIIVQTEKQSAKLIDFGIARPQSGALTVVGTPRYMAPEIAAGSAASPQSDLYSLGVTFLSCMLGRWPYRMDQFEEPDKSVVQGMTLEEEERLGPLGVSIAQQFFRLVSPDVDQRPRTALEFHDDLRRAVPVVAASGTAIVNPTVDDLRRLYRGSSIGNAGNRGLDDEFAMSTYVPTLLDTELTPSIVNGELDLVLLTGNPGDGKTSFLVKIRELLTSAGAEVEREGLGGWLLSTKSRTYSAVYDASEARDEKSSDELIIQALQRPRDSVPHTALIAINDGRLRRFFDDYADLYPSYAAAVGRDSQTLDGRVAVIDLKRRSLAPTANDSEGLAGHVLGSLTRDALWSACGGCKARNVCPILTNRKQLESDSREPFLDLVTISHLRRHRRATLRDLRSAAAWVITGDRGCSDVHEAFDAGIDLRLGDDALTFDLAFDGASADYLVQEWSAVDPALLPVSDLERESRARALSGSDTITSLNRRAFFRDLPEDMAVQRGVTAYRFLEEFRIALGSSEAASILLPRMLRGLSRMLGAFGYEGSDLALEDGENEGWAVLREVSASEFELIAEATESPFVEGGADSLVLLHPRARLSITLDTAELILRAADGELIKDAAASAIRLELEMLAARLMLHPADAAIVVNPAGEPVAVRAVSGTIEIVRRP
jgi:serine/threonine protein kinase